jgi:CMP-N-acetylneuraminic acid synthetase
VTPNIAAIVPMRHDSERVRGKNYRDLGGRPLYHHIVSALLDVPAISQVVIDTDSPLITEDAGRHFPSVVVVERPHELRGGEVSMNTVLLHDIDVITADVFVQTHSTNPFLRADTITRALEAFTDATTGYDSLFTVTPLHTRLWTADAEPLNHDPNILLRTQELPPVYEENSCLYVFYPDILRRRGNRIGARPLMFPLDPLEAWDIDDEADWTIATALISDREPSRD